MEYVNKQCGTCLYVMDARLGNTSPSTPCVTCAPGHKKWRPGHQEAQPKVKSDGSSSSYYQLPPGATELRHLIQAKNMDFAVGNIFKACYRLGEKHGTEELYDVRKMIFFGFDELEKVSKEDYRSELERFREFIDKELLRLS